MMVEYQNQRKKTFQMSILVIIVCGGTMAKIYDVPISLKDKFKM